MKGKIFKMFHNHIFNQDDWKKVSEVEIDAPIPDWASYIYVCGTDLNKLFEKRLSKKIFVYTNTCTKCGMLVSKTIEIK